MNPTLVSSRVTCPCGNFLHIPPAHRAPVPCIACGRPASVAGRDPSGAGAKIEKPPASAVAAPEPAAEVQPASGSPRRPRVGKGASGAHPADGDLHGAAGGGEPAPAPATVPAQSIVVVASRARSFGLPTRCSCCMGAQQTTVGIMGVRRENRMRYRLSMTVPSCKACDGHRTKQTLRVTVTLLVFVVVVGFLMASVFGEHGKARPLDLGFLTMFLCAAPSLLLAVAVAHLLIPLAALGTEHATEGLPVSIEAFSEQAVTLKFENPAYGALFAAQNGLKAGAPQDRLELLGFCFGYLADAQGSAFDRRKRALVTAALGAIAWLILYFRVLI